jgi:hypothetical protein
VTTQAARIVVFMSESVGRSPAYDRGPAVSSLYEFDRKPQR